MICQRLFCFSLALGKIATIGSGNKNHTFCPIIPVSLHCFCYLLREVDMGGEKMIRIKSPTGIYWPCLCLLSDS